MKLGKHYFKGYVVDITADTKLEDINWIIKKHPEFKEHLGIKDDNSKPKRKSNNNSKSE